MSNWIESHDDIWEHHKTLRMCSMLGIKPVQAVGHLTSLWHFVLRNAWSDANLEPWGDVGIEMACRWDGKPGEMVKALRAVNFLDDSQVHGWLERAGTLVYDRLRKRKSREDSVRGLSGKVPAPQPYPAKPNPPKKAPSGSNGDGFDQFWDSYPRKVGKEAARKAWLKAKPSPALVGQILSAISIQRSCIQWTKDAGQYIPHPATWLNQGRWQDEVDMPAAAAPGLIQGNRREL